MVGENNDLSQRLWVFILTAFLLLLLIGGGIAVFEVGQGKIQHDNRGTGSATPPKQTPTVTLTPQPLFFDDFVDNSKGWSVGNIAGYSRTVERGKLTLTGTNHRILIESLPTTTVFYDFSLTTTFTLMRADENDKVGLYLRGDSNLDHDYRVDIFGDGRYAVAKESLNFYNQEISNPLIKPSRSDALKPVGKQNTLSLVMKGATLELIMNGTIVNTITDTDYTHGQIALFVEHGSTSEGVSAVFSNIEIAPAPYQLPSSPTLSSGLLFRLPTPLSRLAALRQSVMNGLPHPPPPGVAMVKRSLGKARK